MSIENETNNLQTQETEQQQTQEQQTQEQQEQKTEEQKTEEQKTEEQKTEEFVPLTAEAVKLPEGFTVDEPTMTSFLGIMNNQELSAADRSQQLIDLQASVLTQASEANSKAWDDLQETWKGEVKADPEIGGAKFDLTMSNISKLLDQYGSKETRDAFSLTGAGNNPHIVKFMSKLAGKLTEGTHVSGSPGATTTSAAERMFPSMKKG